MGLECEWRHARKRGSWKFEDFENSQLGVDFGIYRQTDGLSDSMANSWSWGPTMMVRSWVKTMMLRSWSLTMQLKVDIGPWRQTIESLPLGHRELSSLPLRHVVGVLQISTDRDLKHLEMRCAFVGSDSMVSIRIASLFSCRRTEVGN